MLKLNLPFENFASHSSSKAEGKKGKEYMEIQEAIFQIVHTSLVYMRLCFVFDSCCNISYGTSVFVVFLSRAFSDHPVYSLLFFCICSLFRFKFSCFILKVIPLYFFIPSGLFYFIIILNDFTCVSFIHLPMCV